MKHNIKKLLSYILTFALVISLTASLAASASAAPKSKPKLSKTKVTMNVGKKTTLKVKNVSKSATIKWKSSNKKVATVSSKGKVTAKKAGTAKITATVNGKKCTCKVTVKCTKHVWKKVGKVWVEEKGHYKEEKVPTTTYEWVSTDRLECNGCGGSFYSDAEIIAHFDANKEASWNEYGYLNTEAYPCALASHMIYSEGYYDEVITYETQNVWVVDEEGHYATKYKCKTCSKTKTKK